MVTTACQFRVYFSKYLPPNQDKSPRCRRRESKITCNDEFNLRIVAATHVDAREMLIALGRVRGAKTCLLVGRRYSKITCLLLEGGVTWS
jgi:hypothetical protein